MNDGARILQLQETDKAIALLAAQRQLYADAKLSYLVCGVVAIVLPVVVSIIPDIPALLLVVSAILPVVLGRVLTSFAESRRREAASVQQEFDAKVFGISFPNTDHDRTLAAKCYRRHVKKRGVLRLREWYPCHIGGLQAGEAICECQKVNICWTKDLAVAAFAIDALAAAISIFIAVLGINRAGDNSMAYVLLVPIIVWVTECGLDRWHLYSTVRDTHQSVKNLGRDDEDTIMRVQSLIYESRCLRPVPDFVYRLTKKREQWKADHRL